MRMHQMYTDKLMSRLDAWWERVHVLLPRSREQIIRQRNNYRAHIQALDIEYAFGRYRGGQVFVDSQNKQMLIDPDAVGYKLVGDEIVSLMRTSTLLPVHQFADEDEREWQVNTWISTYQDILTTTQGKMLLFYKLIETIVMDFDYLITDEMTNNPAGLLAEGIDLPNHLDRGIKWNSKILEKTILYQHFLHEV